jgi:nitroreductase
MDAIEAILSRRVQRAFSSAPVEPEKIERIVDAGRHAMSARNLQPWQFVIVRDRASLARLGELCTTGKFVGEADVAIIVLKDGANARWADVDCAHAVQSMANAGWAMGLGTCWVGNFDAKAIGALLEASEPWTVFTVLPFGYQNPASPPQARPLKPRRDMVHYEKFGRPKP